MGNRRIKHSKVPFRWQINDSIVIAVVILFITCWLVGKQYFKVHLDPFFEKAWPAAESYENSTESYAEVFNKDGLVIGYIAKGLGDGYGGPLTMGLAIDTSGNVKSLAVLEYRETPSFFLKVLNRGLLKKLIRGSVYDSIPNTVKVDAISGATLTSNAIFYAVDEAISEIAVQEFGVKKVAKDRKILFGLPEIILIALFLVAVLRRKFVKGKNGKRLRWLTLIVGFIFLGFVYNRSFVLTHVNIEKNFKESSPVQVLHPVIFGPTQNS